MAYDNSVINSMIINCSFYCILLYCTLQILLLQMEDLWQFCANQIYQYHFFQQHLLTFLVAQMVKHLSAMQETQVRSLGWEDTLEKEIATDSSTLAWKNPMDGGSNVSNLGLNILL